jgi:para-aminobenzoate synthetase component 1
MTDSVTTLEQWRAWRREGYNTLPLLRRVRLQPGEDRPAEWSGAWAAAHPHAIVLESGKDGRYTYLGLRPSAVLRGKGYEAVVSETGGASGAAAVGGAGTTGQADSPPTRRLTGKPLEVVRAWIAGRRGPSLPDGPKWTGGIAGLFGYDIVRSIERLPELAADDLGLPDYQFLRLDELWIIDHEARELILARQTQVPDEADDGTLAVLHEEALRHTARMREIWDGIAAAARAPEAERRLERRRAAMEADRLEIDIDAMDGLIRPFSKRAYMDAVERIRAYIAAGDVFQVNLSQRMSKASDADPDALYEWLRLFNPSPYMGYLRCPDFRLVSASPELLVAMRGGRLSTRPIAGTRRRGRTPEEDRMMAEELLASEKERAEHIMLVDLERNDLGRISKYGTVRVKELMTIEYYSHVMHLVSQVEGELADGKDALDVIGAVFPGGTITGAPKVRTMEILEELEPTRRGPYYGSLGWIDYSGDMEFNILIRTMVVADGFVHIQAGGGIVIDSDPEREYKESLNKAKALWKAVQYVEREAEGAFRHAAGAGGPAKEERR